MNSESKDKLTSFLQKFKLLNVKELDIFVDAFEETKVKKRQFIVQPNFVCKNKHYIVEGAFRSYVIGDKGKDHTISFAIEDWWISDYNSFLYQKPATMFVIALEDSTILQISYEKEQELRKSNPKNEALIGQMAERGLAFHQRRIISNLTQTAEERYDSFIEKYPQVTQKLPQYALASYLGMTTEFLSRIRKRKLTRKEKLST